MTIFLKFFGEILFNTYYVVSAKLAHVQLEILLFMLRVTFSKLLRVLPLVNWLHWICVSAYGSKCFHRALDVFCVQRLHLRATHVHELSIYSSPWLCDVPHVKLSVSHCRFALEITIKIRSVVHGARYIVYFIYKRRVRGAQIILRRFHIAWKLILRLKWI